MLLLLGLRCRPSRFGRGGRKLKMENYIGDGDGEIISRPLLCLSCPPFLKTVVGQIDPKEDVGGTLGYKLQVLSVLL